MVKQSSRLDATFSALADPTRRAMLAVLIEREATVSELAAPYDMSLPAVMKHLGVLQRAGLVSQHKVGRERHCRLTAHALKPASDWIAQYSRFWERTFDSLDRYLAESQAETELTSLENEPNTKKEKLVCRKPKLPRHSN